MTDLWAGVPPMQKCSLLRCKKINRIQPAYQTKRVRSTRNDEQRAFRENVGQEGNVEENLDQRKFHRPDLHPELPNFEETVYIQDEKKYTPKEDLGLPRVD